MDTLAELYKRHGYDFVAITDHRLYYKTDDANLNGCEYNCYLDLDKRYHFHLLTLDNGQSTIDHNDNTYKSLFYTSLDQVQDFIDLLKSKGNMVFIAHPKNIMIPLDMMLKLKNYDGIEVYNSKADSDASDYYERLLEDRDLLCLSVDDSHAYEVDGKIMYFRGYIVIEDDLEPLEAIKSGAYYASTGARIDEIIVNDFIEIISPGRIEITVYNKLRQARLYKSNKIKLPKEGVSFRAVSYEGDKKAWTNLIRL
ncbi:hypothetical protein EZV73_07785 [Acidaminobacter sp. JC074]|uniref:PHP domain-containing protein n=1 Tax=Acidaminobacter sp. JC074 TaxID=2530199 RepID=UPI001F113AA9|nr:hypothetical protein [Acidaminobacter sp. JC074]MCH4887467.1 hypothetical protein [Acidaminobacter sp. JC074]